MGVAIFDDALTLLRFGVPEEHQPNTALIQDARASTQDYLRTLDEAFINPADQSLPRPDLDRLRNADIPTVSDREFADAIKNQ